MSLEKVLNKILVDINKVEDTSMVQVFDDRMTKTLENYSKKFEDVCDFLLYRRKPKTSLKHLEKEVSRNERQK